MPQLAPDTEPADDSRPDLRATGERIETLLDASAAGGQLARERAEELVRSVVDLYGAALERLLEILYDAGHLGSDVLESLAADELVASLLAVHGLHPYDVTTRVMRALDGVRPYLGSHGGDVELVGLTESGVVRLRMLGSCDGCPSSSVTLTLAVETAILSAAPEVTGIQVEDSAPAGVKSGSVIPVSALRTRLDSSYSAADTGEVAAGAAGSPWLAVDGLETLGSGEIRAFSVAGAAIVVVRVGNDLYAYMDACARCHESLARSLIERRLGGDAEDAVLRCPTCNAHYDVRRAGAGLDDDTSHLDPLPLLVHEDVPSIAIPGSVAV